MLFRGTRSRTMELSRTISLVAVVLIVVVALGYAASDGANAEPADREVAAAK
jgi:hypothetical protein